MDATMILTMLLPIRMVEISLSSSSDSLSASAARLFPLSANTFSRVLFRDENAVSVALK